MENHDIISNVNGYSDLMTLVKLISGELKIERAETCVRFEVIPPKEDDGITIPVTSYVLQYNNTEAKEKCVIKLREELLNCMRIQYYTGILSSHIHPPIYSADKMYMNIHELFSEDLNKVLQHGTDPDVALKVFEEYPHPGGFVGKVEELLNTDSIHVDYRLEVPDDANMLEKIKLLAKDLQRKDGYGCGGSYVWLDSLKTSKFICQHFLWNIAEISR